MKQHVLVTGGGGYIGSILVPELLSAGYTVTVVDNFRYSQNSLAYVCAHPEFHLICGDVRDYSLMRDLCQKADVIIPLAALVGAPLCDKDPIAATTTNRDAIVEMLSFLSSQQSVLMPISNSGYGTKGGTVCDETSPLNPISLYAKHKVEVESRLMERENVISFRLATVFGMSPRMRIDLLVNDFTYRAVHDRCVVLFESHFKRNYIHVRDVAGAFLLGMREFDRMKGEIYNVGLSDANLTKKELCAVIKKQLPKFSYVEADIGSDPDKRDYIVSNKKIENTGFRTQFPLDWGIRELIKGYAMLNNSRYTNI